MKKTLFCVIAIISMVSVNAKVWRVNNTPGVNADFTTFNQAQNGAKVGDTLMFEGSNTYYGNEKDTLRKPLTIIGPGYFINDNYSENDNILPAKLDNLYIDTLASNSVVMGMHINGSCYVSGSNIIIERNYANNIYLGKENTIQNVVIAKNFIDYLLATSTNYDISASTNIIITNNIIDYELRLNSHSTAIITNNCINRLEKVSNSTIKNNTIGYLFYYNEYCNIDYNLFGYDLPENGVGNVYHEDFSTGVFITGENLSLDGAYQLSSNSVAKGIGENGVDCGAFGSSTPYVLSGFPPIPVVTNVVMPTTVTNELSIQIQAKAQE